MVCVCDGEDVLGFMVVAGITIENNQGFLWFDAKRLTEVLL